MLSREEAIKIAGRALTMGHAAGMMIDSPLNGFNGSQQNAVCCTNESIIQMTHELRELGVDCTSNELKQACVDACDFYEKHPPVSINPDA